MNAATSLRDSIRATVFASKPKSVLVSVGEDQIEVRQPLVGQMIDSMDSPSTRHRMARMLIMSCFVPGTNDPVFEEADFDSLMALPATGIYSQLITAVEENIDLKKVEAAEKKP